MKRIRIFKYTPLYANGQVPEIYEDDYFTIVIPTPFVLSDTNKGTINRGSDTINGTNDTIKNGTNDTINGTNDTINGGHDTNKGPINGASDTINGASDTINDTINGTNDTINGGIDTNKDTIKVSSDTIKLTVPDLIIQELKKNPYMTATELGKIIGINRRNTAAYIKKLIDAGLIIRVGAKKNGHWEVVEP